MDDVGGSQAREPAGPTEATRAVTPGEAVDRAGTLRRPAHRVDPKARFVWFLSALVGWLFVVVPTGLIAWLPAGAPDALKVATVALAVIAVGFCLVMPEWRYRVHRWEVTDDAVYTLTGWISQTSRIAPISRVQTVDSHFGPIQRAFGLGTLKVTTASAHGAVEVAGLARPQVEELVARLTAITARDEGDAT